MAGHNHQAEKRSEENDATMRPMVVFPCIVGITILKEYVKSQVAIAAPSELLSPGA